MQWYAPPSGQKGQFNIVLPAFQLPGHLVAGAIPVCTAVVWHGMPAAGSGRLPTACGTETFAMQVIVRSEEHTSELQSLMRNSYAVFCLNKKKYISYNIIHYTTIRNQ